MSNIRFRSLSSATYSVTVAQAGATAALSTEETVNPPSEPEGPGTPEEPTDPGPDLPEGSGLEVTLSVNRSKGTAPSAFWFEAKATGFGVDNPDHDLLFVWDFADTGAEYADLSGRLSAIPVFKDANLAYGPWVAHAYRRPGSYKVTCTVHGGIHAPVTSAPLEVTVEDPDAVFGLARTVYASNGTDFSGVPAGAKTITTTNAAAALALVTPPRRVLFRRGDTFAAPGVLKNNGKTSIGDWGDAAKPRPVFDMTTLGLSFRDAFDEVAVVNIVGRGSYDQATRTGSGNGFGIYESANGSILYDNCLSNGNTTGFSVAYIDCEVTNWCNYGIYGGFRLGAFLGTWVHSNPDGFKFDGNSTGGAGMRIERTGFENNVGFTYFGCTAVFMNYAGRFNGDQPGYKLQGDSLRDARFNIDRQITEGSSNTNHGVGSKVPERQNAIYDKLIHIGTAQCGLPLSIQNAGTTVRNFYFVLPHVEFEKLSLKGAINPYALNLNPSGSSQENLDGRFRAYGGTVVHWMDWATQTGLKEDDVYTAVNDLKAFGDEIVSNVVIHAPFAASPIVAAVDTGKALAIDPIYKGRRAAGENGDAIQTKYRTPATFSAGAYRDQPTVCLPTPQGALLTADAGARECVPLDDIDGTLRGARPAKGAFKP
jgi:hypothetical protein